LNIFKLLETYDTLKEAKHYIRNSKALDLVDKAMHLLMEGMK